MTDTVTVMIFMALLLVLQLVLNNTVFVAGTTQHRHIVLRFSVVRRCV